MYSIYNVDCQQYKNMYLEYLNICWTTWKFQTTWCFIPKYIHVFSKKQDSHLHNKYSYYTKNIKNMNNNLLIIIYY